MEHAHVKAASVFPFPCISDRRGQLTRFQIGREHTEISDGLLCRSDILKKPGAFGVSLVGGSLVAADAAADIWGGHLFFVSSWRGRVPH